MVGWEGDASSVLRKGEEEEEEESSNVERLVSVNAHRWIVHSSHRSSYRACSLSLGYLHGGYMTTQHRFCVCSQ